MPTSRQLHLLATRPDAYLRYLRTGALPQGTVPAGPLVDLLKALAPYDLSRCTGVTIDHRLGYAGSRLFHCGTQALQWVRPAGEPMGFPAESWRDKRFARRLFLEDFIACCAQVPGDLQRRYPRLCRPRNPAPGLSP